MRPDDQNLQFATLSTKRLKPGAVLRLPVSDDKNVLLLAAGTQITSGLIEKLLSRGVLTVRVHRSEVSRLCGDDGGVGGGGQRRTAGGPLRSSVGRAAETARESGAGLTAHSQLGLVRCSGRFLKSVERHGTAPYCANQKAQVAREYQESVSQVDQLFRSVRAIRSSEMDVFEAISDRALADIARDIDLFVSMGVLPESDRYPARHSQQTAMLAMAMGANLGIEKRDLIDLGVGCLAHDVGMLHLKKRVFQEGENLDSISFLEITKHPTITFDLMSGVEQLAGASRMVAYQMHERCDGSGYPRGRSEAQIHPLARIAAVADTFTALISPRPHRAGLLPYRAVELILNATKQGQYDALAARSLLRTVSLFPLGSYVELSDRRVGRVLRANGDSFTQPVIEAWNQSCLDLEPEIVDLTVEPSTRILRPLQSLERLRAEREMAAAIDEF